MDVALGFLFFTGLVGAGVLVGLAVRSMWALLFPPLLTTFWIAGNTLFAEHDPDITVRAAVLSALAMIMVPVAAGTMIGILLHRRSVV